MKIRFTRRAFTRAGPGRVAHRRPLDTGELTTARAASHLPRCWRCGSRDTMVPFDRSERIPLLSHFLPLRWRYCRRGGHHFLDFRWPKNR